MNTVIIFPLWFQIIISVVLLIMLVITCFLFYVHLEHIFSKEEQEEDEY